MECKGDAENRFVILVTGMAFEACIANIFGRNFKTVVSGGSQVELEKEILELINQGGKAIISYGMAGGLRESLIPGKIVIGSTVIDKNVHFQMDSNWTSYLQRRLPDAVQEQVLGVCHPIIETSQKKYLCSQSGAGIVDMESHVAAKIAKSQGIPCVVLRVILDGLQRDLPWVVSEAIKLNGKINFIRVMHSILRNPRELIALVFLTANTFRAVFVLLRCNRLLGKGFGFFDLQ